METSLVYCSSVNFFLLIALLCGNFWLAGHQYSCFSSSFLASGIALTSTAMFLYSLIPSQKPVPALNSFGARYVSSGFGAERSLVSMAGMTTDKSNKPPKMYAATTDDLFLLNLLRESLKNVVGLVWNFCLLTYYLFFAPILILGSMKPYDKSNKIPASKPKMT